MSIFLICTWYLSCSLWIFFLTSNINPLCYLLIMSLILFISLFILCVCLPLVPYLSSMNLTLTSSLSLYPFISFFYSIHQFVSLFCCISLCLYFWVTLYPISFIPSPVLSSSPPRSLSLSTYCPCLHSSSPANVH